MEENNNDIKLYSISAAAKKMCISRETLRSLMTYGKIGYIPIGKSKKLSHQEILRFQKDNTIRSTTAEPCTVLNKKEIKDFFHGNIKTSMNSLSGDRILETIIRRGSNGNS
jgi:hypothetical protein